MDDPFSSAANAVGIISLGLHTCDQIIGYCQAWSNYSNDIQRLSTKADSLRVPLRRLRELTEDAQLTDPKIADDLERKTIGLQDSVERLKERLETYRPVMDTFSDRVRTQLNEVTHQFRRDSLRNLENDLDSMHQNVQTTLEIYMTHKIARLGKMQEKTLSMVQEMHSSMSQAYTRGMPAPELLRSWCDLEPENSQHMNEVMSLRSEIDTEIQDMAYMRLPTDQRWVMALRRDQRKYRTKLVVKTYRYYSRLLNLAITASFTATSGAGGISFSPLFKVQFICSPDSWQSKTELYSIFGINVPMPAMTTMLMDDRVNELRLGFEKGEASPTDMIPSACYPSKNLSLIDALDVTGAITNKLGQVQDLSRWVRFLGSCGCVPNNQSSVSLLATLCQVRIWKDEEFSLASYLLDIGGPLEMLPKSVTAKVNMKWILSKDEDAISCPDIIKIIIRESPEELEGDLLSGNVKASDRIGGQLLLDYAIGWPQGVHILLEHGADPNSVEWTCRLKTDSKPESPGARGDDPDGVYDSVKILLDAGYRVNVEQIKWPNLSRRVQEILIQGLIIRRRKLWEWAQPYLAFEKLVEHSKEPDEIVDIRVADLLDILRSQGKNVEHSLQESRWWKPRHSVYHAQLWFLYPETLEELYTAGFRDTDAMDPLGVTPSMTGCLFVHDIQKWAWFASKGADCGRKLPQSNATVAHLWSASIVQQLFQEYYRKHMIIPSNDLTEWKESLSNYGDQVFLLPTPPDGCLCPCSPGGCTTLSVVFRNFSNLCPAFSQAQIFEKFPLLQNHFTLLTSQELHTSMQTQIRQILQILIDHSHARLETEENIIRSLTFEGLGLKHACCTEINRVEPDACLMKGREHCEVEEILSEGKQGYQELEVLMNEFGAKFEVLGVSLWKFLTDHWQPRMMEYLSQRDPYNEGHEKETRRLGIFLNSDEMVVPSWLYFFGHTAE